MAVKWFAEIERRGRFTYVATYKMRREDGSIAKPTFPIIDSAMTRWGIDSIVARRLKDMNDPREQGTVE